MLKVFLLFISIFGVFCISARPPLPCAYWCGASCVPKSIQYYCCSYQPSLMGPISLLDPPCQDLCLNRTNNQPAFTRNCLEEKANLTKDGAFKICHSFKDCDTDKHDLCCKDNCLPSDAKMCVKL